MLPATSYRNLCPVGLSSEKAFIPSVGNSKGRRYVHTAASLVAQWQRSCLQCRAARRRHGFDPWIRKFPLEEGMAPAPVFLPGESHGQRSLLGYGPWEHKELDTTEAT